MHIGLSRTFWDGPYHRDVADSGDIFIAELRKQLSQTCLSKEHLRQHLSHKGLFGFV